MAHILRSLVLLLLLTTNAFAQSAEQRAEVDRLWTQAIAEQGPILTCAFTWPAERYDPLAEAFFKMARNAITHMRVAGYTEDELDTYVARIAPYAVRMPMDTSFQEVVLYCRENDDWINRLNTYDLTDIGRRVQAVLDPK